MYHRLLPIAVVVTTLAPEAQARAIKFGARAEPTKPSPSQGLMTLLQQRKYQAALRLAEQWRAKDVGQADADFTLCQVYPLLLYLRDPASSVSYMERRAAKEPGTFLTEQTYRRRIKAFSAIAGASRDARDAYVRLLLDSVFIGHEERLTRWQELAKSTKDRGLLEECESWVASTTVGIQLEAMRRTPGEPLDAFMEQWQRSVRAILEPEAQAPSPRARDAYLYGLVVLHKSALRRLVLDRKGSRRKLSPKAITFRDRLIREIYLTLHRREGIPNQDVTIVNTTKEIAEIAFPSEFRLYRWAAISFYIAKGTNEELPVKDRVKFLRYALEDVKKVTDVRLAFVAADELLALQEPKGNALDALLTQIQRLYGAQEFAPAKVLCEKAVKLYPKSGLAQQCREMLKTLQEDMDQRLDGKRVPPEQ